MEKTIANNGKEANMKWGNSNEIAAALNKHYPGDSQLTMSDSYLISKVNTLPGFDDEPQPPGTLYATFIKSRLNILKCGGVSSSMELNLQ
jgi:FeS assembly protein IscX